MNKNFSLGCSTWLLVVPFVKMGRAEGEIQSFGERVGSRINTLERDLQHVDQDLPIGPQVLNQWFSSQFLPLSLADFFKVCGNC